MLVLLVILLSGCAAQQARRQAFEQRQQAYWHLQTTVENCRTRYLGSEFDALRGKIPFDTQDITIEMLASKEKPTDTERPIVLKMAQLELDCNNLQLDASRRVEHPLVVTILDSSLNRNWGNTLELYHGSISFGEYNLKRKQIEAEGATAIEQVRAELNRQSAEAQARAKQIAIQQQQLFMNYLQYQETLRAQQNLLLQQRGGTITCHRMGAFTTCSY